ncbi:hypothetical protein GAY33_26285 [Azospirillum brasilense]|uniref:hypothetical protein n=1 Tax=Azospirillum argentinense TaxID=2970906 RepID=UPI00190EA661|nr:hypothetical protein [Azospirillum argentinense]MBK3802673.1 hypothetical protein [Azospirillum argentinense]
MVIGAIFTDTRLGLFDRSLLLLGLAAARRRSELTAFTAADQEMKRELLVTIRCSNTDRSWER